jgi:hypothetical protein
MTGKWLLAISILFLALGTVGCAEPLPEEEEVAQRPPFLPPAPPSLPGQPVPPPMALPATAVTGIMPTARYSVATSGGYKLTESAGSLFAPAKGQTNNGYTIYSDVIGVVISDNDIAP